MNHNIKQDISHYISEQNVENIRERFEGVIDHYKVNFAKLSEIIDVSPVILCKFIREREEISFVSLMKIENYVLDMEYNIKQEFK